MLHEQQIILEWFLKDHVTLKTGVMAAEINYILKYIKTENSYFKLEYNFTILLFLLYF